MLASSADIGRINSFVSAMLSSPGAYGRSLEPDPHHVTCGGWIVAEVLHPAAEANADFGVDAASRDLGLRDEAGAGQYFRREQKQRQRSGRGRNTC